MPHMQTTLQLDYHTPRKYMQQKLELMGFQEGDMGLGRGVNMIKIHSMKFLSPTESWHL